MPQDASNVTSKTILSLKMRYVFVRMVFTLMEKLANLAWMAVWNAMIRILASDVISKKGLLKMKENVSASQATLMIMESVISA